MRTYIWMGRYALVIRMQVIHAIRPMQPRLMRHYYIRTVILNWYCQICTFLFLFLSSSIPSLKYKLKRKKLSLEPRPYHGIYITRNHSFENWPQCSNFSFFIVEILSTIKSVDKLIDPKLVWLTLTRNFFIAKSNCQQVYELSMDLFFHLPKGDCKSQSPP